MAYATVQDVKDYGLPADGWSAGSALEEITDAQIQGGLDLVAGRMDSYFAARYDLPLVAPYPPVLARCNIDLYICDLFLYRGFNPEAFDDNYIKRCQRWQEWLEDVAAGKAHIPGAEDQTPGTSEGAPTVYGQPLRGW